MKKAKLIATGVYPPERCMFGGLIAKRVSDAAYDVEFDWKGGEEPNAPITVKVEGDEPGAVIELAQDALKGFYLEPRTTFVAPVAQAA